VTNRQAAMGKLLKGIIVKQKGGQKSMAEVDSASTMTQCDPHTKGRRDEPGKRRALYTSSKNQFRRLIGEKRQKRRRRESKG